MRAKVRSVALFVGVLTVALMLQGCLLLEKIIVDTYLAVHGIPDGTEQVVVTIGFTRSYCLNTSPAVNLEGSGQIQQFSPFPVGLLMKHTQLDGEGTVLREDEANFMVNEDGSIPLHLFSFLGICFEAGHSLSVSFRPLGGDIEQNAQVNFSLRYFVPVD